MSLRVLHYQTRFNSLNFPQLLKVDGKLGPITDKAISTYGALKLDFNKPQRIHWHWTGGKYHASSYDKEYYNYLIDGDGVVHKGHHSVEDQCTGKGASHTRLANTGAIGVAVCGMFKATPNDIGHYPVTEESINSLFELTRELCEKHDIRVSPWTTLNHAEVESNLNIMQKNKWDIRFLPGYEGIKPARYVGDEMRKKVRTYG